MNETSIYCGIRQGAISAEEQVCFLRRLIEQVLIWTPRPGAPVPLILALMLLRSYCFSRSFSVYSSDGESLIYPIHRKYHLTYEKQLSRSKVCSLALRVSVSYIIT